MHVAVDANALAWGWGGIPKYVDRIVRELARTPGVRVTLLANTRQPIAAIPGTHEVVCRRRGGTLWRNGFVAPWLAAAQPDVFWAAETLVPWRVPVPAVVTVHDVATLRLPAVKPQGQQLAYRTSTRRGVRAARRVIAVSRATAADAERLLGADPGRLRVVPLGIDPSYTPGDRDAARRALAERFGLREPFVLSVGAIEPRKGLDTLVEAAHAARARRLPWRVVLAGSPGYRSGELLRAAEAAGVVALGRVAEEHLVQLYRAAEALAAPSLYEGFGLPPLEAMACGTPAVVASGSGGLVEMSGPAAVVVADRRPEAWVDAVEQARARRRQLARAGLQHSAGFRWPAVAEATLRVLGEAAGRQ